MEKEIEQVPKSIQSRGIYLLPNLLTTAALFSAFYAIIATTKGQFEIAAMAIFIAMVADALDGRVARMTNTQTAFGAEYDSLSDLAAFGVAPSLLIYSWSLSSLGKIGWLVAFLYTAATALRLARFNTQVHHEDKNYSQGLACTPAAGVIAGLVWLVCSFELDGHLIAIPVAVIATIVAGFMVSTIRYNSFKQINWKERVPFFVVVLLVLIIATIATDPPHMLFAIFFIYAFSGPVMTLWQIRKVRKSKKHKIVK